MGVASLHSLTCQLSCCLRLPALGFPELPWAGLHNSEAKEHLSCVLGSRACPVQGDLPEGWGARRLVVGADLAPALADKFGVAFTTLCTVK